MDALDVGIIRAMGVRPYDRAAKPLDVLQPAHIARKTGASVNTVKERIARMTASGFIAGYNAIPNFRHLGLASEAYYVDFSDEERKDAALAELMKLDGTLEIHDFLGRGFCADLAFGDRAEVEAKLDLLTKLAGSSERPRRFYSRGMPPVARTLTPLDWRILQALRADPRAGAAEIAEVVNVSARTVKRHLSRMAAEGSVFLVPILDPGKAEGIFVFDLLVYLREGAGPRPLAQLRAAFTEEHMYAHVPAAAELGNYDMLLFAKTSADVEKLRRRAEAVPGVARAEAWLFRGVVDRSAWLDDAIARAAANAGNARG